MTATASKTRTPLMHLLVKASAGAGKTHALTTRYIALLRRGVAPQTILATTFTRKAAGEILGRLLTRLAAAALDDAEAAGLAKDLHDEGVTPASCREMLAGLAGSLHRVSISTLDSFFNRVAGGFRHELGVPARPILAAGGDPLVRRLRRDAIEAMLEETEPAVMLDLLRRLHHDGAQRSVSESIDSIVAGLYDTYRGASDEAAWSRLVAPAGLEGADLAAAVSRLRRIATEEPERAWGKQLGRAIEKHLEAAERADWQAFLAGKLVEAVAAGTMTYYRKPLNPRLADALVPLAAHAEGELLRRLANRTRAIFELMKRYDKHFTRLRAAHRVLLFSDLSHKLARELPALGDEVLASVYYRLDGRVSHLLLDEFQDTSLDQWAVLRPIAEEIVAHGDAEASGRSVFCVGDAKQAIYGWRGGCAEIFDCFADGLRLPGESLRRLSKSYRASQAVLDAVNTVFGSIGSNAALEPYRELAEEWQRGFAEHKTGHPGRAGYVELVTSGACEAASGDGEGGAVVNAHDAFAAARIAALARSHPGRSIGVLVSTHKAMARLLHLLREVPGGGVEASGEGGSRVTDDPAVGVVLAALTMADHPGHTAAAFHVRHSPLAPILGLASTEPGEVARVSREIRRRLLDRGYARVVTEWARQLAPACTARNVVRLTQLAELADGHDAGATLRPGDFVELAESARVEEASPAAVRVMTIHAAKGLEFDLVVLPDLSDLLVRTAGLPVYVERESPTGPIRGVYAATQEAVRKQCPELRDAFAQEEARALRDDLCALYVAMTRPRFALHLIVPPMTRKQDGEPAAHGWTNRCYATILRRALRGEPDRADGGETLYAHGEPGWSAKVGGERASVPRERLTLRMPEAPHKERERVGELVGVDELLRME